MGLFGAKGRRFLGPNVYPKAPDGGWGWVVAVAFFLVEAFTYGTIKIFAIFFQDLTQEFNETNSRISWIVSICVFVMTFNSPLSPVLTNRLGFQPVVMAGGLLISVGTIATSFASSIDQMYITYGLIAGMGYSLTFLPTVSILSQYFTHRRSLVTAVASTGESLSMFALTPAFSALKRRIQWRHTMAVIGALQSIIIICGALLRPIIIKPRETHDTDRQSTKEAESLTAPENIEVSNAKDSNKYEQNTSHSLDSTRGCMNTGASGVQSLQDRNNGYCEDGEPTSVQSSRVEIREFKNEDAERQAAHEEAESNHKSCLKNCNLLDFSILREPSFICYSLFGLFATLGFFAPQLYIIKLSVSRGVELDRATFMLSTMALGEILGRFTIGWVLTWKLFSNKKLFVLLACVIVMTADLVGFTLVTEVYGLSVCCALYGFFMGTIACTHIPMLAEDDVVGVERMSSAAGVYVFIHSFAGLAGPPLGGVLVDVTQNYGSAFYSCAGGMALSAIFLGLVQPAKRGKLCRSKNSKHLEDKREGGEDREGQSVTQEPQIRTDTEQEPLTVEDHNPMGATGDVQDVIRFA